MLFCQHLWMYTMPSTCPKIDIYFSLMNMTFFKQCYLVILHTIQMCVFFPFNPIHVYMIILEVILTLSVLRLRPSRQFPSRTEGSCRPGPFFLSETIDLTLQACWQLLEISLHEECECGIVSMIQMTMTIVMISTERVIMIHMTLTIVMISTERVIMIHMTWLLS